MVKPKNKRYIKFIFIIMITLLLYFVYYKYVHNKLIELTNLYSSDKLETVMRTIENNTITKLNELKTISEMNFKYRNSKIDYNKIMSVVRDTLTCESVFIGDLDGKCVSENGAIMYMQRYEYFQKACKGETTLGNPLYSYEDKKWVTSVASPIRNDKGEIEKILVAFYDVNELQKMIENIDFGEGTISFITTYDKVIVVSNSDDISNNLTKTGTIPQNNTDIKNIKFIQDRALEVLSGEEKAVINDEVMQTFIKPFKNSEWVLITAVPENVLYDEIFELTDVITVITFVIVLIMLAGAIYSSVVNQKFEKEKRKREVLISNSNLIVFKVNANGAIIDYNEKFSDISSLKLKDFGIHSIHSLIPEDYYNIFDMYFENVLNKNNKSKLEQLDMPIINDEGNLVYILWNANIYDEEIPCVEFVGTNISTLKEYERKIQKIAYFDQLTGLNNLVYLEEYFNNLLEIKSLKRINTKLALIYIDIDNFKYINDMFGHSIGDNFIVDLSNRLLSVENPKVKVCKRSGDEFVILYEMIEDESEIEEYIDRIFKVIKNEYYINNVKINISASIGIGIYPDDCKSYTELIKCASMALQNAKEDGKNRVKYFNNSMKNEIYEIIAIENDLKNAIDNKEFVLYYQPQYNINDGTLYGFESLIRWLSPKKGFVQPDKFIPQAEKNQLIIPIGKFAFVETCNFINELVEMGFVDLCISVNISAVQMMCDDFVDFVIKTIKEKHINPKNIKLEITETVLIKSIDDIVEKINQLNKYGIKFSLDDFGTGYSSLTYLKKIPIEVLKIDKSFTDTILEENNNKEILTLIINLAKSINIDIVAEGVEEEQQLSWLKEKGCNIAQGFYMGKPMDKEKAIEIIGKNMYEFIKKS